MGYQFNVYGNFKFNKPLPPKALETLQELSDNWADIDPERSCEILGVNDICAFWTPWVLNENKDGLTDAYQADELNHNYWFIDWICWIIQGVCIPNNIKLYGEGGWTDDYDPTGNGSFTVVDNIVKVKGMFFGSDHWKTTVRKHNKIVSGKDTKVESKPAGDPKGSFCVTGKVSVPRNELQKIGVAAGFEFKSTISSGLTYLVCNDQNTTSSKMKKAKTLGVKVISEDEFMKIIGT